MKKGVEVMSYVPRAKAICWDDGATQPVSGAWPTLFWNPTIPAMAGQRCWQNLCIYKIIVTHLSTCYCGPCAYHLATSVVSQQVPVPKRTAQRVYVREKGERHKAAPPFGPPASAL